MNDKRSIVAVALLAAAVTAAAFWVLGAAPIQPASAALEAEIVDHTYQGLLRLTVPIFGLVYGVLIYSLLAFRSRGPQEQGAAFSSSRGGIVETLWISGSLVLTLGLAAFGAKEYRAVRGGDHADLDVQVTGSQFSWDFYYPAQGLYTSSLILPKDKRVRVLLTSKDVVHSFWVPQFRIKQDAVPGKIVPLHLTPNRTGKYTLLCAELCGLDHTAMTANVEVVEADAFEASLKGEDW